MSVSGRSDPPQVLIETQRLLLRAPAASDLGMLAALVGDAEVMRYIGPGSTGTRRDARRSLDSMLRAWAADGFGSFTVGRRADSEPIGVVGFLVWDSPSWRPGLRSEIGPGAEIELGWRLARSAWGEGYATEAALVARDWGLREIAPRRLISLIYPDNHRSLRVAEKIGARHCDDVVTYRGIHAQLWALPGSGA